MFHQIKFRGNVVVDLLVPGRTRLERLLVREGTVVRAQVQPGVEETKEGPMEVANLFLEDGTTLMATPMGWFAFED